MDGTHYPSLMSAVRVLANELGRTDVMSMYPSIYRACGRVEGRNVAYGRVWQFAKRE